MAGLSIQLIRALSCGAPHQEVVSLLGQVSNWDGFCSSAAGLRLLPFLYRGLLTRDLLSHLAPHARENLKAAYFRNLGHSIACTSLTTRVLEVLASGKIEAILLKGVAHAHDCYLDSGERVIGDIDLLLKLEDLERASSLLSEAGFGEADVATPAVHHHLPPFTDGSGLNFELHHNLAPPLAPVQVDSRKLWERARPSLAFRHAFLLAPVDSLIHTSIHLWVSSDIAGHVYELIDIDRLVRIYFSEEARWEELVARAAQFSAATPVFRTLSCAVQLIGTPVPAQPLQTLRRLSSRWNGLLHIALATIGGREGIPEWRYQMYRDILSYRKIALLKPSGLDLAWYLSTRPGAMALDMARVLLAPLKQR